MNMKDNQKKFNVIKREGEREREAARCQHQVHPTPIEGRPVASMCLIFP